jgi:NTE family protein
MAFHLGCLRVLHDRGILSKVCVLSTVSGGSVIGAAWAYHDGDFETFDSKIVAILRRGLQREIVHEFFVSIEGPKIIATLLVAGLGSLAIAIVSFFASRLRRWWGIPLHTVERQLGRLARGLPIWGSLTTAFEAALTRRLFGKTRVDELQRTNLQVLINACDLRTGTAFRFGSTASGGWRYGQTVGAPPTVAKAVAASAAFPILLPPLVEKFEFERNGQRSEHVLSLTDGGVYDNLGVAALEPGKAEMSIYDFPVTHVISLNAGAGQFEASEDRHYWWIGRVKRSFEAVHRKAQDAVYQRLHKYVETGDLKGFGMIYLGQQDAKLPWRPADFVARDEVRDYPTDFARMSRANLELLTTRGEQLTTIIVERYLSELGD